MENNDQFMQCMNLQFQFLIMKHFEVEGARHSVEELSSLMAPNMKNIGLSDSDGDKLITAIKAIMEEILLIKFRENEESEEHSILSETDQPGVYEKGHAGFYADHIIDVLNGIANAFKFEIDKRDFLFTEAYEKLDAASADKTCIFTEQDKSDFIRLYQSYVNNYFEYDSLLNVDAELEYLVASIFHNKNTGSKVTTQEIYEALEPNCQLWLAKDRTRTEEDFHSLIDSALETLSNINLQVNLVDDIITRYPVTAPKKGKKSSKDQGEDKSEPPKSEEAAEAQDEDKSEPSKSQKSSKDKDEDNPDPTTELRKAFLYSTQHLSFQDVIKWSPALKVWRSQDSFPDYWTCTVSLMEDQLDLDHDEGDDSYGYTPFSWENILTDADIFDIIENVKLVEGSFNESQFYRIGVGIVKDAALYVVRVKDFETNIERVTLYLKEGHKTKELSFSFVLSRQNDALQLKDLGLGVDAAGLAKILKEVKDKYEEIPVQYTCQKRGWIGSIFGGAEIVGQKKYSLHRDTNSLTVSSKNESSLLAWTNLCAEAIKDSVYGQIILAASFASALVKPLDKTTLIMNLCGKSSIGKTTFESLATSVWSNPKDPRIHFSFSGTELGIIANLNDNYGVCVVIDDTSKGKIKDFTDFIYEVEDGQSRARLGKDHKPEPVSHWSTSVLLSSELSIIGSCSKNKKGVLRRLYEFDLRQDDLTKDAQQANKIDTVIRGNYGVAGLAFMRYIFDNGLQNDLEEMYAEQLEITRQMAGEDGVEQGMAERSAIILLAAQIANDALNLGFDLDAIANCLAQTVQMAVQNFDRGDFSREELREIFNEILPDIKEKAIKVDDNYYHVLVDDFSGIEREHGKEKNELRDLFNLYDLTKTDKNGNTHTIAYQANPPKQRKVISIVKAVD